MNFDGEYYKISFSSAQNANKETVYSIGKIKKRRFPNRRGSSSKNGALKNGRKSSNSIIYTTEDKSQEVKTAIQLAFEKAFKKQAEKSKVENNLTDPKSKDDTIVQHILIKIILLIIITDYIKEAIALETNKKTGFYYLDKKRTQSVFKRAGIQSPRQLDNLSSDIIIKKLTGMSIGKFLM